MWEKERVIQVEIHLTDEEIKRRRMITQVNAKRATEIRARNGMNDSKEDLELLQLYSENFYGETLDDGKADQYKRIVAAVKRFSADNLDFISYTERGPMRLTPNAAVIVVLFSPFSFKDDKLDQFLAMLHLSDIVQEEIIPADKQALGHDSIQFTLIVSDVWKP